MATIEVPPVVAVEDVAPTDNAAPPSAPIVREEPSAAVRDEKLRIPDGPCGVAESVSGIAYRTGTDGRRAMLVNGAAIRAGDRVQTEAASRVRLLLTDGTSLFIGPQSEFVLDEYLAKDDPRQGAQSVLSVARGVVRVITANLVRMQRERVRVHTGMATVGIRGCDVVLRTRPGNEDIALLSLSGGEQVTVTASKGGARVNNLSDGTFRVADGASMVELTPAAGEIVHLRQGAAPVISRLDGMTLASLLEDTNPKPPAQVLSRPDRDGIVFEFVPPVESTNAFR